MKLKFKMKRLENLLLIALVMSVFHDLLNVHPGRGRLAAQRVLHRHDVPSCIAFQRSLIVAVSISVCLRGVVKKYIKVTPVRLF